MGVGGEISPGGAFLIAWSSRARLLTRLKKHCRRGVTESYDKPVRIHLYMRVLILPSDFGAHSVPRADVPGTRVTVPCSPECGWRERERMQPCGPNLPALAGKKLARHLVFFSPGGGPFL